MSTTNKHFTVAIDGPCAAGKTTQAKLLAKALGYMYMDTGALYRTVALYMLKHDKTLRDIDEVLNCIDMYVERAEDGSQRVYLSGKDVTSDIRTSEVSMLASDVSAHQAVRDFLLDFQRDVIRNHDVVMEGRDIGTVIAPNADVKIFLTANVVERARRRHTELKSKGSEEDFTSVMVDLMQRDHNDINRKIAPLKQADDAVYLDCTEMDIETTHATILRIVDGVGLSIEEA